MSCVLCYVCAVPCVYYAMCVLCYVCAMPCVCCAMCVLCHVCARKLWLSVRIDGLDQLLLGVRVLVHALVHGLARSLLSAGLSSAFRGMGGGEAGRGSQVGADSALSP